MSTQAELHIRQPGLFTTVQDFGRPGFEHLGVPTSGSMDRDAMILANALVDNPADTPVLEMMRLGPTFEVQGAPVTVALACSGTLQVSGKHPRNVPAFQAANLFPGDVAIVSGFKGAACLAIRGGIDVPAVMGSASTYTRSGFGGHYGRTLQQGDSLTIPTPSSAMPPEKSLELSQANHRHLNRNTLRIVKGPQDDHFSDGVFATLIGTDYTITTAADRMGVLLDGETLNHNAKGFNITSDATALGSIQVPGDGLPIILGADRQTTGGYPKIATVISSDMPALARLNPGETIRFQMVGKDEAEEITVVHRHWVQTIAKHFAPVSGSGRQIDIDALWSENLISGVVGPSKNDR